MNASAIVERGYENMWICGQSASAGVSWENSLLLLSAACRIHYRRASTYT